MIVERPKKSLFVLASSPVQFSLTAPSGVHKRVVARSAGKTLDLAGLDRTMIAMSTASDRRSRPFSIFSFGINQRELDSHYAEASVRLVELEELASNRTSFLGFGWRGLANESSLKKIHAIFDLHSEDIAIAIHEGDQQALEWQIAPVIAMCIQSTRDYQRRLRNRQAASWLVIIVYAIFGFVALEQGLSAMFK